MPCMWPTNIWAKKWNPILRGMALGQRYNEGQAERLAFIAGCGRVPLAAIISRFPAP